MKKVLMIIRDGWGYREEKIDNAIATANTPFTDYLMEKYPHTLLDASGPAVGLPKGYQGNSEVGHMAIGSGRIIYQSLARINNAIDDGNFFKISAFVDVINHCKNNNKSLHLISLLQTQGVHAHISHLFALLDLCVMYNFSDVKIHVITDGRDAPVTESLIHLQSLEDKIISMGIGEIVTISGRYYAMDRDNRWERTQKAYDCIVDGECQGTTDFFNSIEAVKGCHENEQTDEFIIPIKKEGYNGIAENDGIIFVNFRTDRTRQLTKALLDEDFVGFKREWKRVFFVAMTQFYDGMAGVVAFAEIPLNHLLGELVSNVGYRQLRISETEKYAHVTFFMNGQQDAPFLNEDRILIDSPKVATYDLQPEMSVEKLSDRLVTEIEKEKYQLIITNFVNGDMVGHSGVFDAIVKGVEAVDSALEKTVNVALVHDYVVLVFADHGNAEDQSPKWRTSHTLNPVPFIFVGKDTDGVVLKDGKGLKNIAATVLELMGINKPKEMEGSLV